MSDDNNNVTCVKPMLNDYNFKMGIHCTCIIMLEGGIEDDVTSSYTLNIHLYMIAEKLQ